MTTESQRAELLELAAKATPRPWEAFEAPEVTELAPIHAEEQGQWVGDARDNDIAYIAAACNLAPELAREVESAKRRAERAEKYLEEVMDTRDAENLAKSEALTQLATERERAEKAERERDALVRRFVDVAVISECICCPSENSECSKHSHDCHTCWLSWAAAEAAKSGA